MVFSRQFIVNLTIVIIIFGMIFGNILAMTHEQNIIQRTAKFETNVIVNPAYPKPPACDFVTIPVWNSTAGKFQPEYVCTNT